MRHRHNLRSAIWLLPLIAVLLILSNVYAAEQRMAPPNDVPRAAIAARFAKLPLSFEENRGQAEPRAEFLVNGEGHSIWLSAGSAAVLLNDKATRTPDVKQIGPGAIYPTVGRSIRIQLEGAALRPAVAASDPLPGRTNYLFGSDAKRWVLNVPHFRRIKYSGVYPGIDLVYYGSEGRLESDFVLAAGTDPKTIRFAIKGAEACELDRAGDLLIHTSGAEIRLRVPSVYQQKGSERREIAGAFRRLGDHEFGFEVGQFDASVPLVIDPVLSYSTYLGGTGNDGASAIAVDPSGNTYIAGNTACCVPATPGAFESTVNHNGAGFITKFDVSGSSLIYSTYLYSSTINAIALDSNGNVYATGSAGSGFPVTAGAFQSSGAGSVAFVAKLNAQGNGLIYGTLLGPSQQIGIFAETTYGNGIAIDDAGDAYVTGATIAPNFPTTPGAYDTTCGSDGHCNLDSYGNPTMDGFVTKVNPLGSALLYSTYLGGSSDDYGAAIAVDKSGDAYITGPTASLDFAVTQGAFQTTPRAKVDSFVTKLNPSGSALVYSTFLAGNGDDWASALALDSGNNVYIAGSSNSLDFPTTSGSLQPSLDASPMGGAPDAFITKLNAAGNGLVFSTYLGGTGADEAYALALDSLLNVYVAGSTNGADFPTQKPFQAYCLTCPNFNTSFVAELNSTGSGLIYSSFLGGGHSNAADDEGQAIAVDREGNAHVAGITRSFDFPTVDAFQPQNAGPDLNTDAFVAEISPADGDLAFLSPARNTFGSQPVNSTSEPVNVDVRNIGNVKLNVSNIEVSGDFKQTNDCGSSVAPGGYCTVTVEFAPTAAGNRTGVLTVTDSAPGSPHSSSLAGTGTIAPVLGLSTYNLSFGNQAAGTTSHPHIVTITNGGSADLVFANILVLAPFKQANSTCGSSLGPLKSCALGIVFAPIQAGDFTGEILFATNDPTSTAVINLSGAGTPAVPPNYSLDASPSSSTITSGGTATYSLNLTPAGGFNQSVVLSCSGAPAASTCAISPGSISMDGANPAQASVSIKTTPHTYRNSAAASGAGLHIALGLAMWGPFLWVMGRKSALALRTRIALIIAALILPVVAACGGGGSNPPPPIEHGTPPGTYSLVVSGTSAGVSAHSVNLTLVVQ